MFFIAMGTNSLKIPSFFKFGAVEAAPIVNKGCSSLMMRNWPFEMIKLLIGTLILYLPVREKGRFDFDDEIKIGDVKYDNMTKITIKVQLFRR